MVPGTEQRGTETEIIHRNFAEQSSGGHGDLNNEVAILIPKEMFSMGIKQAAKDMPTGFQLTKSFLQGKI